MSWSTMMSWFKQKQVLEPSCTRQPPTPIEVKPPTPTKVQPITPAKAQPITPVLTDEGLAQLRKDNNNAGPVFAQNAAASIMRAMQIKAKHGCLCKHTYAVRERVFSMGSDGTETYVSKDEYKWSKKDAMLVRNQLSNHFPSLLFNFRCVDDVCSLYLNPCIRV